MPEVPFGSVVPIWPAVPAPASAAQSGGVLPNGTITGVPLGTTFPGNAYGLTSTVPAFAGLAPSSALPLAGPLTGVETRFAVSAAALLAAVGMRRGLPWGPTSDNEIEDFVYDALELLSGTNDVEVRCEGGRVTLTGSVTHRRLKRDIGEIVWTIPAVNDVQNTIAIAARRRSRGHRENETPTVAARKQA